MYRREGRAKSSVIGRVQFRAFGGIVALVAALLWIAAAGAADKGNAAKGKEIYTKSCASCHGAAGKGDGPAAAALNPKPKDLTDKAYTSKLDDAFMTNIIAKGGAAVGKAPLMPPFASQLNDQAIKDVTAYIRSLAK